MCGKLAAVLRKGEREARKKLRMSICLKVRNRVGI